MVMKLTSPGLDLGIVVSDLEQSLRFYRDLLGLHYEGSNPVPGGGTMHRLWAAESMIKLVAPESPPEQSVIAGGLRGGAVGLRYFTFSVAELEELMADLAQKETTRNVTKIFVKLKFADFTRTTAERAGLAPTLQDFRSLLSEAFARTGKPVRLIGVGVRFAETTPENAQMDLLQI